MRSALTRLLPPIAGAVVATFLVTACGIAAPRGSHVTPPIETASPLPTVSAAVAQTRLQIAGALATAGYQLTDPTVPFRPPESARLTSAPRAVFQVALPDDPTHGYIVVYEFPDVATAGLAGHEYASYLGTGPGRIQFTPDTKFVLRQVGTTLVFSSYNSANSPGPDAPRIATALSSIGEGFDIPR